MTAFLPTASRNHLATASCQPSAAAASLPQGPGTYKPPAFNDCPREFNVRLMSHADNKVCVHSSKAVGEPPFFLGACVYFAIKKAVAAAREEHLQHIGPLDARHFAFHSPVRQSMMVCGSLPLFSY